MGRRPARPASASKYMPNITHNINEVTTRLQKNAAQAGRNANAINLLAVSKGQPAAAVETAWRAGLRHFGENYLQEALPKIAATATLDIEWHFIGHIQANKTRAIAEHFAWVHCLDRLKIAQRLSAQRPAHLPPLNVCLQVNIDGETSKEGLAPEQVAPLALAVAALPQLTLRGLMVIPAPATSVAAQRQPFRRAADLLKQLQCFSPALASLDTLSMGMSGDMEAAIAEGATWLRIGTAIFGPR